jgi:hypothetical protein
MKEGTVKKGIRNAPGFVQNPFAFITRMFQGLSGSAAGIMNNQASRYHGTSTMKGRRRDAAHRRNIAKRRRRRAHLRGMRG